MRYYRQQTPYTCGAACLRMALSPYQEFSEQILAVLSQTIRLGVTPVNLVSAAELLDYEVEVYMVTISASRFFRPGYYRRD